MCAFMFRPDERFNLISFAIMQSMLCVFTLRPRIHMRSICVCVYEGTWPAVCLDIPPAVA